MKSTKLIALGSLMGAFSLASAQEAPPAGQRPHREVPPELLAKFDTDKDGKLSDEERKAMRTAMEEMRAKKRAEMLKKYDKDGDGELSQEERETMMADLEAQRKALVEKYDANKNGRLDPDEIKAARDAGEEIPMIGRGFGGPGGPRGPGGKGGKGGGPEGGAAPAAPAAPGGDAPLVE